MRARVNDYAAFVRKPFRIAALVQLVAGVLSPAEPQP